MDDIFYSTAKYRYGKKTFQHTNTIYLKWKKNPEQKKPKQSHKTKQKKRKQQSQRPKPNSTDFFIKIKTLTSKCSPSVWVLLSFEMDYSIREEIKNNNLKNSKL